MALNSALLPPIQIRKSLEKEKDARSKAIEFAKNIKRPPLRMDLISTDDLAIKSVSDIKFINTKTIMNTKTQLNNHTNQLRGKEERR